MKILFNTDQIYLHGGIEKVMATKANYFASLPNMEVIILTSEQQSKNACYNLDDRVKQVDLNVNYNRTKSYFSVENSSKAIKHFIKQRKILKKFQPDIIIAPNYNFDHYWLPFIKPKKSKVIKEIHASGYETLNFRKKSSLSKIKWSFNDYILSKYDSIVVLNEDERKYQMNANVTVIPNPIDIPQVQAILENKQVIAAGRIAPVKGFDQLIEAWRIVNLKKPDWQLHIYGESYAETKKQIEKLIKSYNLGNVIHFKGSVNDIPTVMLDYSLYAMSSVTECFPMVLLEALSVGLPIVSYDCPNGPRHIVTNKKDGLLIANQNSNALAGGLLYLIENESTRIKMGIEAKKNSTKFETIEIMQQWLHLFQEINSK